MVVETVVVGVVIMDWVFMEVILEVVEGIVFLVVVVVKFTKGENFVG